MEDDFLNIGDRDGIDAGERFVEEDEFRRDDERTRDLRPPPFAS
jgi:hypothetical protein